MLYQMWQEQAREYHNALIREGNEARLAKAAKGLRENKNQVNFIARFIQSAIRFAPDRQAQAKKDLSAGSST